MNSINENNNCLNELNELKFCEVSRNSISNRYWKFQLSILKNKKALILIKIFQYAKIDPKDGAFCPNFQWRFWICWCGSVEYLNTAAMVSYKSILFFCCFSSRQTNWFCVLWKWIWNLLSDQVNIFKVFYIFVYCVSKTLVTQPMLQRQRS